MAMRYTKEGLLALGDEDLAEVVEGAHAKFRKRHPGLDDIPLPGSEQQEKSDGFTSAEKTALLKDGAIILTPFGQTISSQRESQKRKRKPSFYSVAAAPDGLLDVPSSLVDAAIYLDQARFFIPDTENQGLVKQEELASQDGESLRERLGLPGIDVVIPQEASTLSGIAFDFLDLTGEWLFGERYGYRYAITKNPTHKSGSRVALVGNARPGCGLAIYDYNLGTRFYGVAAVRLVVPNHADGFKAANQ